jgi:hypothetical protein
MFNKTRKSGQPELIIYSHSSIFYWWPVWIAGFIMTILTGIYGTTVDLDGSSFGRIMASSTPGLIFALVILLVILITNIKLSGIYSLATVLGLSFIVVLFAWFGWWDDIFGFLPTLSMHINMGFYLIFSTALLIVWLLAFFVFDRLVFWRITPGQMTEERLIGDSERSYDARGMLFEKQAEDFFRHAIIGLGSGDLQILTSGARKEELYIPNVVFVDKKVRLIQNLIAIEPDTD